MNTSGVKKSNNALVPTITVPHLCTRSWLIGIISIIIQKSGKHRSFQYPEKTKKSSISQLLLLFLDIIKWFYRIKSLWNQFKIQFPAYALKSDDGKKKTRIQYPAHGNTWQERPTKPISAYAVKSDDGKPSIQYPAHGNTWQERPTKPISAYAVKSDDGKPDPLSYPW